MCTHMLCTHMLCTHVLCTHVPVLCAHVMCTHVEVLACVRGLLGEAWEGSLCMEKVHAP